MTKKGKLTKFGEMYATLIEVGDGDGDYSCIAVR